MGISFELNTQIQNPHSFINYSYLIRLLQIFASSMHLFFKVCGSSLFRCEWGVQNHQISVELGQVRK